MDSLNQNNSNNLYLSHYKYSTEINIINKFMSLDINPGHNQYNLWMRQYKKHKVMSNSNSSLS